MKNLLIKNCKISSVLSVLLFVLLSTQSLYSEETKQLRTAIHIHSVASNGKYTIVELAKIARTQDLDALILTDHALIKAEYGISPFQNFLRLPITLNSIIKYGADKYLGGIDEINKKNQDIIVIPGSEVTPFYYWTGNIFKKDLTINDWQKQILVIGYKNKKEIENLPVASNNVFSPNILKLLNLLWPIVFIIIGIKVYAVKKDKELKLELQTLRIKKQPYKKIGAVLIVFGVIFSFNNTMSLWRKYDIYHRDIGIIPYQNLIDYANKNNLLCFWSAPEASSNKAVKGVRIRTNPYPNDLLKSNSYTGFGILYEGYRKVGGIGGVWDKALAEYCNDKRENPVWAIGEIDFHGNESGKQLNSVQTVLPNCKRKKDAILSALKNGAMYALYRCKDYFLILEDFRIVNEDNVSYSMGQTATAQKRINILISLSCSDGKEREITINLVKNGKLLKKIQAKTPMKHIISDMSDTKMSYYRLDIRGKYPNIIMSNPVFVKKLQGDKY
ncbi:hypothetical protein KKC91_11695 [bacterium]|nr:hypothetical protein [bacterium]